MQAPSLVSLPILFFLVGCSRAGTLPENRLPVLEPLASMTSPQGEEVRIRVYRYWGSPSLLLRYVENGSPEAELFEIDYGTPANVIRRLETRLDADRIGVVLDSLGIDRLASGEADDGTCGPRDPTTGERECRLTRDALDVWVETRRGRAYRQRWYNAPGSRTSEDAAQAQELAGFVIGLSE